MRVVGAAGWEVGLMPFTSACAVGEEGEEEEEGGGWSVKGLRSSSSGKATWHVFFKAPALE